MGAPDESIRSLEQQIQMAVDRWPEIDPAVERAITRIEKGNKLLHRAQGVVLAKVGLTHEEIGVMLYLWQSPMSHGDLCRELLVSTGAMTNRLDKLERSNLTRRLPDPSDRRGVLVELTDHGQEVLDEYAALGGAREKELLSVLSREELDQLNVLMTKLVDSLQDAVGPPPKRRTARAAAADAESSLGSK